ncbi:hypothetical protein F0562_029805 [Nyssa sinensis]|uniref:Protein TIFY n=1 Tax=Nyssa sinensis TaxID=561372 RepID=A0A5J5AUZ9_9ASTE|nr:hypothetical protein F0562_029805 [Nyssa sinensis]
MNRRNLAPFQHDAFDVRYSLKAKPLILCESSIYSPGYKIEKYRNFLFCSPESMSTSLEFVHSGRFCGQRPTRSLEKSNFSQTCSLLSQYLKEKGTFGDLNLEMKCYPEGNGMPETVRQTATTATTTMNLFPVTEKSGASTVSRNLNSMNLFPQQAGFASTVSKEQVPKKADSCVKKSEPETAQMTIFYGGQVFVFNDLPADKGKEIMLLASKAGSRDSNTFTSNMVQKPIESTNFMQSVIPTFGNNLIQECVQLLPQPIVTDLPIARKASLARFLEKRKDRITARAPYHTSNAAAAPPSKLAESKLWLGLAAQSPFSTTV